MPPILTNISISDRTELRQLILSSLDPIINSFRILDIEAPLPGEPILLLDQENSLVIISFDLSESSNALLNGLLAAEKLMTEAALFKRLYPSLKQDTSDLYESTKVFLLTPAETIDAIGLLFLNEKISVYTFRGIGVDGERNLIVEPVKLLGMHSTDELGIPNTYNRKYSNITNDERKNEPPMDSEPNKSSISSELTELSSDELLFFQQL